MGKSTKTKNHKYSHPKRQHQDGASKQGGAAAFRVSSNKALKAKHKTKQVNTNLKWMKNKSSKEQVSKNNAAFSSVQESMTATSSKQAHEQVSKKVDKKADSGEQVDMDAAVMQMASL